MKLLKIFSILTLAVLTGCGEAFVYNKGDVLLVQTDPNQAPYSVKVISKTPNGYNVEVYHNNHQTCEIPSDAIIKQIKDAADEMIAVARWTREHTDVEYQAKAKEELSTKRKMLWCGFIPMVLVLLCYVHGGFSVFAIPYMIGGCIVMSPFTFLSIFFFFTIVSVIGIVLISAMITAGSADNPVGLCIASIIYLIMFFAMIF